MSFFGRVAARAGAPAAPRSSTAVPKHMAAPGSPLRRQEMAEEDAEMQRLRRQEVPEEGEMQPLRRRGMPEDETPDEEEGVQTVRRREPDEDEVQPLRRQEERQAVQVVRRRELPNEEGMQMLRRQEEQDEPMQALRRQDEAEEPMQALRRLEEDPEAEEAGALRLQQDEEGEVQALRRRAGPQDAATLERDNAPTPPSFSALPGEPRQMRSLRRDLAAVDPGGGIGGTPVDRPGPDGAGDAQTRSAVAPPFRPGEPSGASEHGGFAPEPRRGQEARPRVVIEHMDVVIGEPAGGGGGGGGGGGTPDSGRRLKSRYLRGL